ncbi:MAG: apolipoprotein N-acyltransferase [Pyrinomonadaceae bacterium]
MNDAKFSVAPVREQLRRLARHARANKPTLTEVGLALLSALLLILSFPDFNLWPLAWVALVPLFLAVVRRPNIHTAFLLGWISGTLFFYGSSYWVTYSMIRYGHIPAPVSYVLLVPPTLIVGLFPAACCAALAVAVKRWGARALFAAPFFWAALEWARLGLTGLLWNAIGYSQAFNTPLIQTARWGGVYLVGFLIVSVNASLAYTLLQRNVRALITTALIITCVALLIFSSNKISYEGLFNSAPPEILRPDAVVVALQPDVPMEPVDSNAETAALIARHVQISEDALRKWEARSREKDRWDEINHLYKSEEAAQKSLTSVPRVVIWPESPMNFQYARDTEFRELLTAFAKKNRASVIFNALEPAPANGAYNAAMMVNEEGRAVAQYDKIRLMPFGEYVPLPRWLPGVAWIPTMVGEFTPGTDFVLMPLGEARAGVFICFESTVPSIARKFSDDGADVLINISNDGYLGPTPVMRQHLANAVFRAVENDRPVLRVTNTGITAYINERGTVSDETVGYQTDARTWTVRRTARPKTFYTQHGDLFAIACALVSILIFGMTFRRTVMSNE